MDTRERIIAAASEIARGADGARLSVRAVAARAGVGASTLRHYFPTQHELMNTVLMAVYEEAMPDERIHDASVPAADRLLECLQHLLAPIGSGEDARRVWGQIYTTFIAPEVTDAVRAGYLRLAEEPQRRVESWLALLEAEGTLAPGDNRRGAWLLLTVIDGLSIHRALPAVDSPLEVETTVLRDAIASVLDSRRVLDSRGVDRESVAQISPDE